MLWQSLVLLVWIIRVESLEDRCTAEGKSSHYYSKDLKKCLPCTVCHDQRLITLLGCGPDRDTHCGTIEDLR